MAVRGNDKRLLFLSASGLSVLFVPPTVHRMGAVSLGAGVKISSDGRTVRANTRPIVCEGVGGTSKERVETEHGGLLVAAVILFGTAAVGFLDVESRVEGIEA